MTSRSASPFADLEAILLKDQAAPATIQNASLLDFAQSKGLRVTSGFSHGGHNSGSMHYQGSTKDPGAIDVDHRGVDYNDLLAWAKPRGLIVLDERTRPAGQAVWGGPHFHIQKPRQGQGQSVPQRDMLAVQPKQEQSTAQNQSHTRGRRLMITQDDAGSPVLQERSPSVTAAELDRAAQAVVPQSVKVNIPKLPPIAPPDFKDLEEILARDKQPTPATPVQQEPPSIMQGLGNVWNAGVDMLKAVPGQVGGALQQEYQSQQQSPVLNQQAQMLAALTGAASIPTDMLNIATQAPAAIGNAFLGRQAYKPLFPEVYGARDIPGLKENVQAHPIADFMGGMAPVEGLAVAGVKALRGAGKAKPLEMLGDAAKAAPSAPIRTEGDLVRRVAQAENAAKARDILAPLDEPSVPIEMGAGYQGPANDFITRRKPDWIDQTNTPQQAQELSQGFQQRVYDAQRNPNAQIIDPRTAPVPDELGPVKTEATDGGLQIVTRAGQRETPGIQIDRGLPEARTEYEALTQPNTINPTTGRGYDMLATPARDSAEAFKTARQDVKTAEQLHAEAVKDYQAKERAVYEATGMQGGDIAEAQRTLGARINELEAKAQTGALAAEEGAELTAKRTTLDELLTSRKNALDAQQLLEETQKPTARADIETPPERPLAQESAATEQPGGLTSTRDLAMQRARQIDMLAPETAPAKAPKVEPSTSTMARRTSEPIDLLDAQGRPMRGPKETPQIDMLRPRPTDPASLEIPRRFDAPDPKVTDSTPNPPEAGGAIQPADGGGGIYKTPQGGEVYTHGRDIADIRQQLEGVKGQIATISDIERHLQTYAPDNVPAVRNLLKAGEGSEAAKFSYIAREAPGEPARVRDNFIPTHFTFETIKPATQRTFLRKKYGSDDAVISHLKQEIVAQGGSVNASMLQTKGGGDIAQANQISRLITTLDGLTGGAYLKSPRVHGINLGETTRSAAGDRGIRLDTITDSSLTGRKVTPEELQGHAYDNQIAPALKALNDLAASPQASPVFKRAVKQIQSGGISRQTVRELKAALNESDHVAAQFCNALGLKP
jgi:hypothetical protein